MNKILVAGGAGFIGSNLCHKLLLNDNNEIYCIDNFYTGLEDNISDLYSNHRFKLFRYDITKRFDFEVDEIYNLACPASPVFYQKDPVYTTKTNIFGIINLLDIARKYNAKILQASTSEIYGEPLIHPQAEDYWGNVNCTGIRACYDEGKRCAESLMYDYNRMYGVNIRVVRIFNTYGPNMSAYDGRVIPNFIMQALQNIPITIYGDGMQTRSLCYVDDLIDGMIKMMEYDSSTTTPINLGNTDEMTVLEIAKRICLYTKSKSILSFNRLPQDDPTHRKPNIELAQNILNWEPKISFEDGIKKTIQYFRKTIFGE